MLYLLVAWLVEEEVLVTWLVEQEVVAWWGIEEEEEEEEAVFSSGYELGLVLGLWPKQSYQIWQSFNLISQV